MTGARRDQIWLPYAIWKAGAVVRDFGVASQGFSPRREKSPAQKVTTLRSCIVSVF